MTPNNRDRTVQCPVKGCDAEVSARGVNLHVRNTDGKDHGPAGEVPDHINFDDLTTVDKPRRPREPPQDTEKETVEVENVHRYIVELVAEGKFNEASRAQRRLVPEVTKDSGR